MATKPRLPACNVGRLKSAIATVAANRQFSASELREYTHPFYSGGAPVGCNTDQALKVLLKRGFMQRVSRGKFFPTRKGWRWIEGR